MPGSRLLIAGLMMMFVPLAAAQTKAPVTGPLSEVRVDEHLGKTVPFDTVFTDASGRQRKLGDYFNQDKPVLLTLVYYDCPMLCTPLLNNLTDALKKVDLEPGADFEIVTVSIDTTETHGLARDKGELYVKQYGKPGAAKGWHWHVGSEDQVHRLSDAVGFHYALDPVSKEYAHQAVIFVLTPDGKISRYLYGIDYKPRDLKLALLEAGREHIASTIDKIILFCFHYDPQARGYSLYAWRLVQISAGITAILVAMLLAYFWRRERKRANAGRAIDKTADDAVARSPARDKPS